MIVRQSDFNPEPYLERLELITNPGQVTCFLETITTTLIRWLHAQLDTLTTTPPACTWSRAWPRRTLTSSTSATNGHRPGESQNGHRVAVMGNVPPLEVGVRQPPEVVERSALECLAKGAPGGGMILSFGGGVAPGTPSENIDALLRATREWSKN